MEKIFRIFTTCLVIMTLAVALTACSSNSNDENQGNQGDSGNQNNQSSTTAPTQQGDQDNTAGYTYNYALSVFPTNWNPHTYQTATDAEILDYTTVGFYTFDYNETKDGYRLVPAMAASEPVDVTAEYTGKYNIGENDTARAWRITLRDDLKWEDGTEINAHSFVNSAKFLLNPDAQNYRADTLYSGNLTIANARNYLYAGQHAYVEPVISEAFDEDEYISVKDVEPDDAGVFTIDGKDIAFRLDDSASWGSDGLEAYYNDDAYKSCFMRDGVDLYETVFQPAVNTDTVRILSDIKEIMKNALAREAPDFFSMGYYVVFSGRPIPDMSVSELNTYLRNYMDENFMNQFRKYTFAALKKSAEKHNVLKKKAISLLEAKQGIFLRNPMEKKTCYMEAEAMINAVERAVDKLEIQKDSMAYTFRVSLNSALADYFDKTKKADIEAVRENVNNLINRILEHYKERLSERDYAAETEALILFLKKNASGVVLKITKSIAKYKAIKLMEEVGISDARKRYKQYPFEFSGGMRQRIVIAIALAANPDILICDEPTTALDVTIQAQILELINKIKADRNLSIIFITHDLGVVANMADRIAVMYAGKIVEVGTSRDVFYSPAHPYTWALLSAMPDMETKNRLEAIPGTPPNMIFPPVGEAFAERNKYALKIDFEQQPPMFKISETHSAATWLLHPYAPKLEPPKSVMDRINRMKAPG